ncbi:hypothetical protein Z043_108620 [Scleropages formosus]|uniref:GAIN-B domain-containing protein n=1 Tax=Scleropages formosus TaxID=113540 RepID=A0A0P7USG3_SCLFO|nr:hypothetical protein Z043_108620 [Scleropages formosus]
MAINATNAQTLAQQLSSFTSRASDFTDMMDVIFVTHIMEKLMRYVDRIQDLGDYVSDIASNMMQVEEHVLWMAQSEARACTRMVQCVERIADLALTSHTQAISKVSPNIALKAFTIKPSSFTGLSCTAVQRATPTPEGGKLSQGGAPGSMERRGESLLHLKCNTANLSRPLEGLHGKLSEASRTETLHCTPFVEAAAILSAVEMYQWLLQPPLYMSLMDGNGAVSRLCQQRFIARSFTHTINALLLISFNMAYQDTFPASEWASPNSCLGWLDRSPEKVMEIRQNGVCYVALREDGSVVPSLIPNTVAVASIQLPLPAALSPPALQSVDNSTCKLQFIVFRNGKLFPCTGNSSNLADDGKRRSVSTPVAFTKLDGCRLGSLSQSITIALRHFALGVDPAAAHWDFDLLDGHGGWRAESCHITGSARDATTIQCTRHSNFAVLMSVLFWMDGTDRMRIDSGLGRASSLLERPETRWIFTERLDMPDWEV